VMLVQGARDRPTIEAINQFEACPPDGDH
jgi:hypothetical protein